MVGSGRKKVEVSLAEWVLGGSLVKVTTTPDGAKEGLLKKRKSDKTKEKDNNREMYLMNDDGTREV